MTATPRIFFPRRSHLLFLGAILCLATTLASAAAITNPPSAGAAPSPTATASPRDTLAIDQLDQKELQTIIDRLRDSYVDPKALTEDEITRATVHGLLARIGPGAFLQRGPDQQITPASRPFKAELIDGQFGYIRLGTLSRDLLPRLDSALSEFRDHGVAGVVLDLRTSDFTDGYPAAAEVLSRFLGSGVPFFRLIGKNGPTERSFSGSSDAIYTGLLAVVIGPDTAGPAEAIGGALKTEGHALLVGEKTAARAVEYQRFPVEPGVFLNVAVAAVRLPNGAALFPGGVHPDIDVKVSAGDEATLLRATDSGSVVPSITEDERAHNNEASLVAGKNPELDALEAQGTTKAQPPKLKDVVLERALDFLTTANALQAAGNR